ncbi:MAG: DNA adenine methylase [Desulfovibrio sp.]
MQNVEIDRDRLLLQRLNSLSVDNDEYWSFRGDSNREYCHGIFQYPAMMVPQLVRVILAEICSVQPKVQIVGDPFVGSGTVLTESLLQGKDFWGVDINPLAILLCKVKRGPFKIDELRIKIDELIARLANNTTNDQTTFNNVDKWFRRDVRMSLSKLRECIRGEEELSARRFFWIAMAETVRLTSNSRTSTFKLHIRTPEEIDSREDEVENIFRETIERNFQLYKNQSQKLCESRLLNNGQYIHQVGITLGDIRAVTSEKKCDLIITSPPYGDNATTVPYGQYSYLPLQWIDLEDICDEITYDPLASTHAIDSASLGGSKKITDAELDSIKELSNSFSNYADSIRDEPRDRINRVTSFMRDINHSLPGILESLATEGLMVWILGNRTVGGHEVPFDQILTELLHAHGARHLCTLTRAIPTKRMALKNNRSSTMLRERIVVIRKK